MARKINNFRGVYMKDELPKSPLENECGIINLQNSYQTGSHWTCYFKHNDKKVYIDTYGDAKPPKELVSYLGKDNLWYNKERVQNYDDPPICGHLCLIVLKKLSNDGYSWSQILTELSKNKFNEIFSLING